MNQIIAIALATALTLGLSGCMVASGSHTDTTPNPAQAGQIRPSPGDHVSFFVIGKNWNFRQTPAGRLDLVDLAYFAEIFKVAGGEVTNAVMQLNAPGSMPIKFESAGDGGAVLYGMSGRRHVAVESLDAELPNGEFAFSFATPAGTVENFNIRLGGQDGTTELPPGPTVTLIQAGQRIGSRNVTPGLDVRVTWTPFETGRQDPNGIADDMIFVMLQTCRGDRAFHSGRPFETPNPLEPGKPSDGLLDFRATDVVIPGSVWAAGMWFELDVEHARLLDTAEQDGVIGLSAFAVTTRLRVQVTGDPVDSPCPAEN